MFFSVLYKRTEHFLHSLTFFIKERNVLFGFISQQKLQILQKKNVEERSVLFIRLKKNVPFFFQFIFIYIYLYISTYIYIYIYIYLYKCIEKRTECTAFFCKRTKHSCMLLRSLQKNVAFFAFFYVLCKRTLRSLHSLCS